MMTSRVWPVVCAVIALGGHGRADADPAPDPRAGVPIQISFDRKIATRDGVELSATIYRDPAITKPMPAVVTLTPYIAGHAAPQGNYFAQHGYVFVAVDDRGRGNSSGTFLPSRSEGKDGYDVIEWVAKQPWCNGSVATWGGSWLGFTQWSIAREAPPHLRVMAPTASVYPGVDYPSPQGVIGSYSLRWLTFVFGHTSNDGIFGTYEPWLNAEYEQVKQGRPFVDIEKIIGVSGTVFREWTTHPREDAFWQAVTPRKEDYAKIRTPILTITGHYDDDQLGALTYYDRHMAYGAKDVTQRHYLVIGPWDHSGTRRPKEQLGGVTFGPGAVVDIHALHVGFYDHVLAGKPRPELLKDRVAVFIMGRNKWVHGPDLAHFEGHAMPLELDVTGAIAGDPMRPGTLVARTVTSARVTLTSDPKYLPPRDKLVPDDKEQPLVDQKRFLDPQPSKVVLLSAPMPAETVLSGRSKLRVNVTSDQPDADVFVDLYEVLPDGGSILLASTMVRLRYRKGGIAAVPMIPGKAEVVELPPFSFFARAIAKGSRIRVVIDSGPQFGVQRNGHTGGDPATEPLSASRIGKLTITTGPDSGSVLELSRPDPATVK